MNWEIELEDDRGTVELFVPDTVWDITFEQYSDFKGFEAQAFAEQQKEEPDNDLAENLIMEGLRVMCGDAIEQIPPTVKGENTTELFNQKFKIGFGMEISMMRVYIHICVMINSFVPEQHPKHFLVDIEGKDYVCYKTSAARALVGHKKSVGETIEVLEYQRRASNKKKVRTNDLGNIEFTLGLTEMAILVRRPGERLPYKPAERDQFIRQRREVFKTVPLGTILELRFFLLGGLIQLAKKGNTDSSLKVHPRSKRGGKRRRNRWR